MKLNLKQYMESDGKIVVVGNNEFVNGLTLHLQRKGIEPERYEFLILTTGASERRISVARDVEIEDLNCALRDFDPTVDGLPVRRLKRQ